MVPVSPCFDCIVPTANGFVTEVKMSAIHPETAFSYKSNAKINKFSISMNFIKVWSFWF
jgi:hypothetical protein